MRYSIESRHFEVLTQCTGEAIGGVAEDDRIQHGSDQTRCAEVSIVRVPRLQITLIKCGPRMEQLA